LIPTSAAILSDCTPKSPKIQKNQKNPKIQKNYKIQKYQKEGKKMEALQWIAIKAR